MCSKSNGREEADEQAKDSWAKGILGRARGQDASNGLATPNQVNSCRCTMRCWS